MRFLRSNTHRLMYISWFNLCYQLDESRALSAENEDGFSV